MAEQAGWNVDVKSCSSEQLVELLRQLRGSRYSQVVLKIQSELVERARNAGCSNQKLVDRFILGCPKDERKAIAKEWSAALGISEEEFKRLANIR